TRGRRSIGLGAHEREAGQVPATRSLRSGFGLGETPEQRYRRLLREGPRHEVLYRHCPCQAEGSEARLWADKTHEKVAGMRSQEPRSGDLRHPLWILVGDADADVEFEDIAFSKEGVWVSRFPDDYVERLSQLDTKSLPRVAKKWSKTAELRGLYE